jgi:hypothetical protein
MFMNMSLVNAILVILIGFVMVDVFLHTEVLNFWLYCYTFISKNTPEWNL